MIINIPMGDYPERYTIIPIPELLELAKKTQKTDVEEACRMWYVAASTGNNEAMFHLALTLKNKDVFTTSLSRLTRYRECEKLLLILRTRHVSKDFQNRIDLALAELYSYVELRASAMGHLLTAKLNGYDVPRETIDTYQKHLLQESVDMAYDSHGWYILGKVFMQARDTERGIFFLEQSILYGDKSQKWVSFAALDLASAYQALPGCEEKAIQALKLAADLGNPEVLRRKKA